MLCSLAGEIPEAGDEIDFGGYRFTIREVDSKKTRIISLTGVKIEEDEEEGGRGGERGSERGNGGSSDSGRDRGDGQRGDWVNRDRETMPSATLGEGKQILHVVRDDPALASISGDTASSPIEILTFVDGTWVS